MQCGACGHQNREGARFCDECGSALESAVTADATTSDLPTELGGGRYRVERFLGEGARKRVYLTHDTRLDRPVAVAVVKTAGLDEAGRRRIDREARAMARLGDHPNIVTVYDVVDDDGVPQIVSQYVGGGTLTDKLDAQPDRRLAVDDAITVGEQLALALAHAHALGIVHRDLKPANVWLDVDGSARLGDFGLAAVTDESRLTSEGMVVGTVAYLAPEQATGRAADTRADLYALGALLYELLTGRPPFLGDDAVAVISQHLNTAPMAPAWHNADVPRRLDALVLQLLAKDPADRPPSADAVAAELRSVRDAMAEPAPSSSPEEPPPAAAADWRTFVGRDDELALVRAACDDAIGGRSRLVLVLGEPGIGKTRLVEEATGYAAVHGAQVCWGHCYDGEVGVPYLPFVEAFRSYVRGHGDDELRAELGNEAPEIATLVSELRQRFPEIPEPTPLDGDAERLRLFDGVATFLGNASREHPMVIVLDDLHWADKPTLLMLQYLARNLRQERVAIIGTYRDVDLDRQHPLADAIAALRRERLYERVVLRGLTRDGVKELIEAIGGQETPDFFADTIYRATEGNPFFVAEVLRHLVDTGALRFVDGEWIGTAEGVAENLPEGVREVIGRRLSRLSDDANAMLTVASAMPGGFSLPVVGTVTEKTEDEVLDLLDEALDAQIVRERTRHAGTYELSHALIRQTLYGELSTPRRVRLHRQIGEALESITGGGDAQLPELAYHWFQAAPSGYVEKAVDYARRAGDRARVAAAHDEAARFYDQALQALELLDDVDDRERADLLLAKGSSLRMAGETADADAALDASAELARRLGDGELLARVALAATAGFWAGSDEDARSTVLEEALTRVGADHPALRSKMLSRLASFYIFVDMDRCIALADEAVDLARTADDPTALAAALYASSWTLQDEHSDEIDRVYDEVTRIIDANPEVDAEVGIQMGPLLRAEIRSDRAAVDELLTAYERRVTRTRAPSWMALVTQLEAQIAILEGRYEDGERHAAKILEYGRRVGDPSAVINYGLVVFVPWREQGRVEPLVEPTRRAVERSPHVPAWRSGLAQLHLSLGQLDDAQRELDALATTDFFMPSDPGLRYGLCAAAEVAAALVDRARCETLLERLLPHAGLGVLLGPAAYHGVSDRYLGLLATALERYDDAIGHHEAALVQLDRMGARPWKARTQLDLACTLLGRDGEGDAARALSLLNEALTAAQEIGMSVLVDEVLPRKLELQGIESGGSLDASIDAVSAAVQGERPDLRRHAAVDGRLTLCFSDIEGYTAMTDKLGDVAMQGVLRAHNEILRKALAEHGGVEVKSQGDGFMLAFADPTAAVRFALDFEAGIGAHEFDETVGSIRVRVGVHTGVVLREGDDFFGRTVIVAARVADRADGGEILVTDEMRAAIDGEIALGPPRDVELKGFSGTRTVHPVVR